jgi:hypothetical protein
MPIDVEVQLILCPHQSLLGMADQANPSWPRPEGVQLELQGQRSDPTGPGGTTKIAEVDPEGDRVVRVVTPGLDEWISPEAWADPADLAGGVLNLVLLPPDDRRLVTARVTAGDPAGTPSPLSGETVKARNARTKSELPIFVDGMIYALGSRDSAVVEYEFARVEKDGRIFAPPVRRAEVRVPRPDEPTVFIPVFCYSGTSAVAPWSGISVEPLIKELGGDRVPLTGAVVTLVALGSRNGSDSPAPVIGGLAADEKEVRFANLDPGLYTITVDTPSQWQGWPLKAETKKSEPYYLSPGEQYKKELTFDFTRADISGSVQAPGDKGLDQDVCIEIFGADGRVTVTTGTGPFTAPVPSRAPLTARLAPGSKPTVNGIPLEMDPPDQLLPAPPQGVTVSLQYEHGVQGQAVDEQDNPLPGAVILAFDETAPDEVAGRAVADTDGSFTVGVKSPGTYGVAFQTKDGQLVTLTSVSVNSVSVIPPAGKLVYRLPAAAAQANGSSNPPGTGSGSSSGTGQGSTPAQGAGGLDSSGANGGGAFALPREALTDLASYPVLTEEITTTGAPAPSAGGTAGSAAGYGPAVDQVIRDVLGWRPTGDVAGFQAALTGAFKLREVEGHTEWTWQQRGYAVQADMGALTGAQASIYARAKNALDQVQPLLAGLTSINPALYPPQDLEAIRTVIAAELQELVSELALPGGPRIQRVNELFTLLTGESLRSVNPDPDAVQGHLGTMRDRFGLTVAYVDTVDEEQIVTNFRIVVEQVLTLKDSWESDRKLLSVLDSNTSLGTILIWLSRGLEAVCESVDDLTFALDSVFIDAAQRQVIKLDFTGQVVKLPELPLRKGKIFTDTETFKHRQAPILLSDLLDWVVRASRDEGPRIVQDAGKDGVLAFAPVLNKLRLLIRATRELTHSPMGATLPDGMQTPRVRRALDVLARQLDEAADLAALVKRDGAPEVTGPPTLTTYGQPAGQMQITLTGLNFRRNSSVFLYADNRQDVPDVQARSVTFVSPTQVSAGLRIPRQEDAGGRLRWQVVLTNEDGAASVPVPVDLRQLSS